MGTRFYSCIGACGVFVSGIHFITDYLEGDVYFKIHRPKHNLDRARNQFALLKDMEAKYDEMMSIVKSL